ncbi:MAG: ribosome-binding factor A [Cyclobacteriaceae bacterium]|jgi:ribosome-binding factor A
MNIEARKYHLIERVMKFDEAEINRMEALLEADDPEMEKVLTIRALDSEKDIQKGNVYSVEEADTIITRRLRV